MREFKQQFGLEKLDPELPPYPQQRELVKAILAGDLDQISGLVLSKMADVNGVDTPEGRNLLIQVIDSVNDARSDNTKPKNRYQVIALLIQLGANVNHVDNDNYSVLMRAVRAHDRKALSLLCESGSLDFNLDINRTILTYALDYDIECFEYLCNCQHFNVNNGILETAITVNKNPNAVKILCACPDTDFNERYKDILKVAVEAVKVAPQNRGRVMDYDSFTQSDLSIIKTLLLQDNIQGDLRMTIENLIHNRQMTEQIIVRNFCILFNARLYIRLMKNPESDAAFRDALCKAYNTCPLMFYNHIVALIGSINIKNYVDYLGKRDYLLKILSVLLTLPSTTELSHTIFLTLGKFIFQQGSGIKNYYELCILCLSKTLLDHEASVFLASSYKGLSGPQAAPGLSLETLLQDEQQRESVVKSMIAARLYYHGLTKESRTIEDTTLKLVFHHSDDLMTKVEYLVGHYLKKPGITPLMLTSPDTIAKIYRAYLALSAADVAQVKKVGDVVARVLSQSMVPVTRPTLNNPDTAKDQPAAPVESQQDTLKK